MIRTMPYTPDEVQAMTEEDKAKVEVGEWQKVLDEIEIGKINFDGIMDLRHKLVTICKKIYPNPLIAYTGNAFRNRFIFDEGFDPDDPAGVNEFIVFQRAKMPTPIVYEVEFPSIHEAIEFHESKKVSLITEKKPSTAIPNICKEVSPDRIMCVPDRIIQNDDTIICRILGKDSPRTSKAIQYFYRLQGNSGRTSSVDNMKLLKSIAY